MYHLHKVLSGGDFVGLGCLTLLCGAYGMSVVEKVVLRYRMSAKKFVTKVLGTTLPGGKPPSWFHGLGPSQKKNILYLDSEGRKIRQMLDVDLEARRGYVAGLLGAWGKRLSTLDTMVKSDDPDRAVDVHRGVDRDQHLHGDGRHRRSRGLRAGGPCA